LKLFKNMFISSRLNEIKDMILKDIS